MHAMNHGRKKAGLTEGMVSIIVNTCLFALKYYAGYVSNSIAVISEAFHTLSDSITSIALIIGFKIAFKPPDSEHPFGHQRFEIVTSVIIGTLLGVVGFEFMIRSIDKILNRQPASFTLMAIIAMSLSMLVKEVLARWAMKLAKRHGSESIMADAWHHRSDAIASGLVLLPVVFGEKYWWLDGLFGLIVSSLIVYTAYDIINKSTRKILGRAPSMEEIESLKRIINTVSDKAEDLHHIHIHEYGDHVEVTLHIRLPSDIKLHEAHEIASLVEKAIKEKLGWEATVHTEPRG
ncbi:MAG: cation diffusion facilitator family transporter [Desulfurococcaceae archaeon]